MPERGSPRSPRPALQRTRGRRAVAPDRAVVYRLGHAPELLERPELGSVTSPWRLRCRGACRADAGIEGHTRPPGDGPHEAGVFGAAGRTGRPTREPDGRVEARPGHEWPHEVTRLS